MKWEISKPWSKSDEVQIRLKAETEDERNLLDVVVGMQHQSISMYAETEAAIYGATEREDGQVEIGPSGEPAQVAIRWF